MGKKKSMSGLVVATLSVAASEILTKMAVHENVYCHHMTVFFRPARADYEETFGPHLGQKVALKVVGIAADEKGQAVVVEPLEGIPSNRTAHITVSCAEGTKPFYSNSLLESEVVPFELELEAQIEFVHF